MHFHKKTINNQLSRLCDRR